MGGGIFNKWRGEAMQAKSSAGEAMYGFVGCTVRQFMTWPVMTVSRQTTMRELALLFDKHDFNAFPVVEDGKLVGIISKFDFLRGFAFTTSQVVPHYSELMSRHRDDRQTAGTSKQGSGLRKQRQSSSASRFTAGTARLLDLEPVRGTPRPIKRPVPLRDTALAADGASF